MEVVLRKSIKISSLYLAMLALCCFNNKAAEEIILDKDRGSHQLVTSILQTDKLTQNATQDNSIIVEIISPHTYQQKLLALSTDQAYTNDDEDTITIDDKSTIVVTSDLSNSQGKTTSIKPHIFKQHKTLVAVVIDVFRAFTTACYILEKLPASYMFTNKSIVVSQHVSKFYDPFLIGKAERGATLKYDIPNSPTRVKEFELKGRNVLHRTEGGANGIMMLKGFDTILVASLANADATVKYLSKLQNPRVSLIPMGHEGVTPSLEDELCAQYIDAQLKGKAIELSQYRSTLREGPGKYFFSDDQWQYPSQDFDLCLEIGRFNFAIQAEVQDGYATLRALDKGGS